jgi:LacI family transcriptional regulator
MMRRPNITDVARVAGVSKSTVSRVLQANGSSVKESTAQAVWQAIDQLGYEPNAVARSMRTDRTYMLLLVMPDIMNPFWPEVARGLQDTVEQHGYSVLLGNSDWLKHREELLLRTARHNRLDGLAINPSAVTEEALVQLKMPVVVLGLREGYTTLDTVGSDSYQGVTAGLDHLYRLGHRRIGFIYGRQVAGGQARLRSYQDFLHKNGITFDPSRVITVPFELNAGRQAAHRLLGLPEPPTAIFASNDVLAIGALQAATALGIRVPGSLSIMGMDDIYPAATTTPPLTTMAKAKYETGVAAAQYLLERIQGGGPTHGRRIAIPCRLIERGTTGPASN